MDYYEFTFTYHASIETAIINDILAAELGSIGFESFLELPDGLQGYIPVKNYHADELHVLLNNFPLEGVKFQYRQQYIEGKDWNETWEKNYFQPICVANQCLVRASFHPAAAGFLYEIIINPKMAFGTGHHATTYLMIKEMLAAGLSGKDVLDMGCGTAVLAILAAKKKAARIAAVDIDEWAYNNALENCRLNGTKHIDVRLGGAEQIKPSDAFDYIFANINRNILLNDIPAYASALNPGGFLYMSGFYREDIPAIEAVCNSNSVSFLSYTEQDNWVAVKTKKCDKP
ncbi:MAG: 50S ribosomal protein L11 methyltransferase [Tannerella sp.]|jgi:ribosomal protein L11 methyltransferase|nr:50S ribosomal protein L11 methyltransferase [Tannerella sp.]